MSHDPESLSNDGGTATRLAHEPTDKLPPFLLLMKQESDQLLNGITGIALAQVPVYLQSDEYRHSIEQDARLTAAQNERALALCESRKISALARKMPLEFLIAQHVIESIPERQQMVQRSLLARYNDKSLFNITIRCVDVAGGIGEDLCNYTYLKGIRRALYVNGRDMNGQSVEEYYDDDHPHGEEKIAKYLRFYEHLGERALSVEDTNDYLRDVASRPRVVHVM